MNIVFKIMAFSIMLNFAVGMMMLVIVDDSGDSVFEGSTAGLSYEDNYTGAFTNEMGEAVNPTGLLEDQSDAFDRVLDMLTLGLASKFLDIIKVVDNYMFGIVKVFESMFDGPLRSENPGLANFLFGDPEGLNVGMFRTLITIGYIIGAIYLLTGKKLNED